MGFRDPAQSRSPTCRNQATRPLVHQGGGRASTSQNAIPEVGGWRGNHFTSSTHLRVPIQPSFAG